MADHDHPTDERAHFDQAAQTWDDPAKLARARAAADLLARELPLGGDQRVLDVGGGTGAMSLALADRVASVTVSDASPGMVAVAEQRIAEAGLGDRVEARQLDLLTESLPLSSYDGAWSMLAFHHVPDVPLLLTRLREAVRPGGFLAVIELDHDPEGAFHEHRPDFGGHDGFTRHGFAHDMAAAGFVDVRIVEGGTVHRGDDAESREFAMFLAVATVPAAADPADPTQ